MRPRRFATAALAVALGWMPSTVSAAAGARPIETWRPRPDFLGQQPRQVGYVDGESSLYVATMLDVFRIDTAGDRTPVLLTGPPGPAWSAFGGSADGGRPVVVPGRGDAVILVPSGGAGFDVVAGPASASIFEAAADGTEPVLLRSVQQVYLGFARRLVVTATPLRHAERLTDAWRWAFRDASGAVSRSFDEEGVRGVVIAPNGAAVAMLGSEALRVYGDDGGQEYETPGRFRAAALSNGGRVVLANPADAPREIVIVAEGVVRSVVDAGGPVHGSRLPSDGRRGRVWLDDGVFRTIETASGVLGPRVRPRIRGHLFVTSLSLDDAGRALAGVIRRPAGQRSYRDGFLVGLVGDEIAFVEPLGPIEGTVGEPDVTWVGRDRAAVRTRDSVRLYSVDFSAPRSARPRPVAAAPSPRRVLTAALSSPTAPVVGTWPLSPMNEDHPLGATIDFQSDGSGTYLHRGIDIPAVPYCCDSLGGDLADAQFAMARKGGSVTSLVSDETGVLSAVTIRPTEDPDTTDYYLHLAAETMNPDVDVAYHQGDTLPFGTWIAKIVRWPDCDGYHHLHFAVADETQAIVNPLTGIEPFDDVDRPTIEEAWICGDDAALASTKTPWQACAPASASACVPVTGARDVVVRVRDLHLAGTAAGSGFTGQTIGVQAVRWRGCPERGPPCHWAASSRLEKILPEAYDENPASVLYSVRDASDGTALASDSDYCTDDTYWMVPTNVTADGFARSGAWDTTAYHDGFYTLEVEAEDYDGNVGRYLAPVCVENAGTGKPKLLVPDCDTDLGTEPSDCKLGASSPKVGVRPTAAPDISSVSVCARNVGSANLGATSEVTLRLRWKNVGYLTTFDRSVEGERVFASGGVAEITRTVDDLAPGGAWAPGEERCIGGTVDLSGVPADNSPVTAIVLEAAVSSGTDVPNDRNDVREDNNRAEARLPTRGSGEVGALRRGDGR